jgi:hypothetical protein
MLLFLLMIVRFRRKQAYDHSSIKRGRSCIVKIETSVVVLRDLVYTSFTAPDHKHSEEPCHKGQAERGHISQLVPLDAHLHSVDLGAV